MRQILLYRTRTRRHAAWFGNPPPAVSICGTKGRARELSVGTVSYEAISCLLCLRVLKAADQLDEVLELRERVWRLESELELARLALAKKEPVTELSTGTST